MPTLTLPLRALHAAQRAVNLFRLGTVGSTAGQAIAQGLRSAQHAVVTRDEQGWIQRIERLRSELNASQQEIRRVDYGAGSPGSERTLEEMQSGVLVTDTIGRLSRAASKPPFWCLVLFKLVRALKPKTCVELGTAVGISAAYQGAALLLNGVGNLTTLEGASTLADLARANLNRLGLGMVDVVQGRFSDTLANVMSSRSPVDYVFIDGHHDEHATLDYFEKALPFLAAAASVIFDDITWSAGMRRAWGAIVSHPRPAITVDMGPMGICVVNDTRPHPHHFHIPLD
jgi:predicted O-methyltransferase YrrM